MSRAIILAGGLGTRLKPYTVIFPKPLMPLGEGPILEVIVRQLAQNGFDHLTLAVSHQADLFRAFFGDGRKWGVRIDYSSEPSPLGTMGPLKLISDLPDNFLVMNGDILTDLNYARFFQKHKDKKSMLTIGGSWRQHIIDYGVLHLVEGSELLCGFEEKLKTRYLVSMGIYCLTRSVLDYIPEHTPFGFDELVLALLREKQPTIVERHDGYWLDIGRPDDYQKALDDWNSRGDISL